LKDCQLELQVEKVDKRIHRSLENVQGKLFGRIIIELFVCVSWTCAIEFYTNTRQRKQHSCVTYQGLCYITQNSKRDSRHIPAVHHPSI